METSKRLKEEMNTHSEDIFEGNMEKYMDPELYDWQHDQYMKDLPLIEDWASKLDGQIVDLACGTGRIAIPLAEKGYKIIGVDLNKGMLERAKEKAMMKKLSIEWVHQDCTRLSLDGVSSLFYMVGNSFQHFLTNESQNQLLQGIHKHLEHEGVFIFGTRFPILSELSAKEESSHNFINKNGQYVIEHSIEEYNSLTQILHCTSTREIYNNQSELITTEKDSIFLRYVFPAEMERLLEQNGFTILNVYGTWGNKPLDDSSEEMIYVCKKS